MDIFARFAFSSPVSGPPGGSEVSWDAPALPVVEFLAQTPALVGTQDKQSECPELRTSFTARQTLNEGICCSAPRNSEEMPCSN